MNEFQRGHFEGYRGVLKLAHAEAGTEILWCVLALLAVAGIAALIGLAVV